VAPHGPVPEQLPLEQLDLVRVVDERAVQQCGAETYAYYDPQSQMVTTRHEVMTVSRFVTAGSFDKDRTGRAENDSTTNSPNVWTTPSTTTPGVLFWIVLRDDRGGVTWKRYQVDVM
jgi:hypothetical protein